MPRDQAFNTHSASSISGTASTPVAANLGRQQLMLQNDHASQIIYLSLGGTAELNKGIRLNAAGGSLTLENGNYRGAVSAIATGASTTLLITEL